MLLHSKYSNAFNRESHDMCDTHDQDQMMSRRCAGSSISSIPIHRPSADLSYRSDHYHVHSGIDYTQPIHHHNPTSPKQFLETSHDVDAIQHNHNSFPSNQGTWQSNLTYRNSPDDLQSNVISPLTYSTEQIQPPTATSSWSAQDTLQTANWSDGSGMAAFIQSPESTGYVNWSNTNSVPNAWSSTVSSPDVYQPPPPATTSAPYRHQSFWAYKRQGAITPPTFADMEMTAEIPYPVVYSPTTQNASTPIHPAFIPSTNIEPTLDYTSMQNVPQQNEDILSDASIRQALSAVRSKQNLRTSMSSISSPSAHTHTHALSTGAVTKSKTTPKGGRVGPLTVSQREKQEDMRTYGACWRCRKYKKPCNGPGICNTCHTSGFRVWPSALGCRRGDFDSFAFGMIPTHCEEVVGGIMPIFPKPAGWRRMAKVYRSEMTIPASAANGDKFDQLMLKLQTTQLTGPGVLELLQIACNLQRGLSKESRVLTSTLKGLSHACDFYSCFVATDEGPTVYRGRFDMINIFTHNRKALLTTLSSFLNSCLTGRMKDWLPTFLSANFIVFTFVMLSDAAVMVPAQFRDRLWASIRGIIMDFRSILYPMAQDLLSALGKGSKLLHMHCWNTVEVEASDPDPSVENSSSDPNSTSETKPAKQWERNREGMKILDGDTAIFDGLQALQHWLERFGPLMRGDVWYAAAPHTVDVLPICSWERMFDFSPRG